MRRLLILPVALLALLLSGCAAQRPEDAVVLTGSDVPRLIGAQPGKILAYRYYNGAWTQMPVQVDERAMIDLNTVYNQPANGVRVLTYTDPGTFTGADPDPTVDANDEIAFMGIDAGNQAPAGATPPNVVAGSGEQIRIHDTIGDPTDAFMYLFRQTGNLDPGAGRSYVDYRFNLLSGPYKTTYKLNDGPNPENSTVSTTFYSQHFSDRWAKDELRLRTKGASGVDILDRHKNLFAPGNCVRSEDTFNDAEGAFIVNKSGPVRAIRSYIGANSGPLTVRQHIFYERREEITTYLRVHAIPGVMDFFDYSPAASGMTYRNNLATGGVRIDGVPETRRHRQHGLGDRRRVAGRNVDRARAQHHGPRPGLDLLLLPRQADPRGRLRDPVHRGRLRLRLERALDQPGDREHRPAGDAVLRPEVDPDAVLRAPG